MNKNTSEDETASSLLYELPTFKNNDYEGERFSNCCGLRSPDPERRKKSMIICSLTCVTFLTVFLPILFLVIIPAVIQGVVNDSEISISQTRIINPSDEMFTAVVTQSYSHTGSLTAKAHMHDLKVYWEEGNNIPMVTLSNSNTIKISKNAITLRSTAHVTNTEELTNFNVYAMFNEHLNWELKGKAKVRSFVNVDVDIDKHVGLIGFNSFPTSPQIVSIETNRGTSSRLYNKIVAKFTSDSNVEIIFQQNLNFVVTSNGVSVGQGTLEDCDLLGGINVYTAIMYLTANSDEEQDEVNRVMSSYAQGLDTPLRMGPFFTDRPVTWLAPALASMSLPTVMPGLTEKLIVQVDMYPPKIPITVPFTISMHNPIGAPFRVTRLDSLIYCGGVLIARVAQTVDFTIPAHGDLTTARLSANSVVSREALDAFKALEQAGGGLVDVLSTIVGLIDQFPVILTYDQYDTVAYVHV